MVPNWHGVKTTSNKHRNKDQRVWFLWVFSLRSHGLSVLGVVATICVWWGRVDLKYKTECQTFATALARGPPVQELRQRHESNSNPLIGTKL